MRSSRNRKRFSLDFSLPLVLLCILLFALCVAGGASRAEAPGQFVVRGVAVAAIVLMIIFAKRPVLDGAKPVLYFILGALGLTLLQLIPLPPGIWQALPGRDLFANPVLAGGDVQPWRPWSIVPGATLNATSSLVIPLATLLLVSGLREREWRWLPGILLIAVSLSALTGIVQASSGLFNPFINDVPGVISGSFANRNHFALFLAIGCLLIPAWMFLEGHWSRWKTPVGAGLFLLFLMMILASGSRFGMMLGLLALLLGGVRLRRELRGRRRWIFPAIAAAAVAMLALVVILGLASDRAVSIERVLGVEHGSDMRLLGLPTVLSMTQTYFPFGAGFGSFDPVYRIHEPLDLLNLNYYNHAHNDVLEILFEGGIFAGLLFLTGLVWWIRASLGAWRVEGSQLGRLGAVILFFVIIASLFDYPARTPMIMATITIAAMWLSDARPRASVALRTDHRGL